MKIGLGISAIMGSLLAGEVVINELHYNSEPNTAQDEFVELHNTGSQAVNLGGWFFSDGVDYTFPQGTFLEPGGYLVIAQNPAKVFERYGVNALGPFSGGLSNSGETVELRRANGSVADVVTYQSTFPWPVAANGDGSSMELINPSLDNDLAGSWRSSRVNVLPELTLIPLNASEWRWRPGTSEASDPITAWTNLNFSEDGTWNDATLPIGFGIVDALAMNTIIPDMRSVYSSVFLRREFEIAPGEVPPLLNLRYLVDDGFVVYINGNEVHRNNLPTGPLNISDTASGGADESLWLETTISAGAAQLQEGTNVIAIQAFNAALGSNDFGLDLELIRPEPPTDAPPMPSPGAKNTVFSQNAPPAIRQVSHSPEQPKSNEITMITAKVTDPDGVASVTVEVQTVAPGAYVPALLAKTTSQLLNNPNGPRTPNPAYEENWITYQMVDDGSGMDKVANDGIFTVGIPGKNNRTLVRYRITIADALGNSIRVPYQDDPQLNFAYFCYDGVPAYQTNKGLFPAETVESIPVYHVLTTSADFDQAVAYNGANQIPSNNFDARSAENWNATFVYDGVVYDNIRYRLRQRNARYAGNGKRSLKFRFNRGSRPIFHDNRGNPYPVEWRDLSTHKMVGSRSNSTWGMDQAANHQLWNLTGTPASFTHWAHFRIIRQAEEAPDQFRGDYYGMLLAMEEFDSRFLDAHKLEKGNLYKLISYRTNGKDVQRYQAPNAVDNASDFSTILNQLRPARDDQWLREHVNWDSWYRYHAVVDMIRHYDVQPNLAEHLKNRAYYFEPSPTNPLGRLNVLPWDSDTSWGPNWNAGIDFPAQVVNGSATPRSPFIIEYHNIIREMRDLVWTPEQIDLLLEPLAATIADLVPADRARWANAPNGSQFDPALEPVVNEMKKFAFIGGSWVGGDNTQMPLISRDNGLSGQQGRDAYLDALVADPALPAKPTITYNGTPGFPQDGLAFTSSNFSDPQGPNSFAKMKWRLSEITSLGGGTREIMPVNRLWSYLDNNVDQGIAWRLPSFDDSSWPTGPAPFGFGSVNALTINTTTQSGIPTAYFRTTVNVTDLHLIEEFTFKLLVDDGAVVYVNGQEAFREGFFPDTVVTHNSLADANGDEDTFDEFTVSPSLFVEGPNVIAIEVHNRSLGSNDMGFEMSIDARDGLIPPGTDPQFEWTTHWDSGELTTFNANLEVPPVVRVGRTYRARVRHQDNTDRWSNWSDPLEFTVSQPTIQPYLDHLIISEIMYHPLAPTPAELQAIPSLVGSDFDWIEIMNTGPEALELANVRFTKGIDFDFITGSKSLIAPGERLVVVSNLPAFLLRYGYETRPDFVVGQYENNLSNAGEFIRLSYGAGTPIREFTYDDSFPWPDVADGSGPSLVLVTGTGENATDWRPSVPVGGTPNGTDRLPLAPGQDLADYALLSPLSLIIVEQNGQKFAQFSYERRLNADDVQVSVEEAENLNSWNPAAATLLAEQFLTADRSRLTYRSNIPIINNRNFFRLKLETR